MADVMGLYNQYGGNNAVWTPEMTSDFMNQYNSNSFQKGLYNPNAGAGSFGLSDAMKGIQGGVNIATGLYGLYGMNKQLGYAERAAKIADEQNKRDRESQARYNKFHDSVSNRLSGNQVV